MKKIYLALLALYCIELFPQAITWTATTNYSNSKSTVCKTPSGHLYLYKSYEQSNISGDTIRKLDGSGNLICETIMPSGLLLTSLVAAADNGFYAAGYYYQPVSIGNSTYEPVGATDMWFAKYNQSAQLQWFKTWGGKDQDYLNDVCISADKLIFTGSVRDTLFYKNQIFPKDKSEQFFIASYDIPSQLLNVKFGAATSTVITSNTSTQSFTAFSYGTECETDAMGNIYVLMRSWGKSMVDTFNLGDWDEDLHYQKQTTSLVKFNAQLQPLRKHFYEQCNYFCWPYENLVVSATGNSYVLKEYSYGQSGNDILKTTIYALDQNAVPTASFVLRPDKNSRILDLDIDACGNVYFTGFWRDVIGTSPYHYTRVVGQLNPNLTANWIMCDSSQAICSRGVDIVCMDETQCFITGQNLDTLNGDQGVYPGAFRDAFFAKVNPPSQFQCVTQSTESISLPVIVNIYPNPASGIIHLPDETRDCEVNVYNTQSTLVMRKETKDTDLHVENLPNGLYILRFTKANRQTFVAKVIVQQ